MTAQILVDVAQVVTCESPDERCVRSDVAIAISAGRIGAIGPLATLVQQFPGAKQRHCGGGVLTPGFVDAHTHAVFGGWRAAEYAMRAAGVPYMEIARRGGGINASVRDVRVRSEEELTRLTRDRLRTMLSLGTTTAEVKSGYGLETSAELKMLRVVRTLAAEGPVDLEPTFLGAHEFPPEYADRRDAYVDLLCDEMIPAVAEERLARFCDVFMEPGVFDGVQARRVLEAGLENGLIPRLHADEFEWSGGAELGAELGASSADHLACISDAGITALAASRTTAVLLPATMFFLGKTGQAPARRMLDAGVEVAVATDFNPGSAPSPSMPLVLTMACSMLGLSPVQAIHAATAGGALALRLTDGRGTIRPGAPADLVLWDVGHHHEIPYHFGKPPIRAVWKAGVPVLA
ncbi:MAG: imidazolonepropionase [Gemmatimonadetes bacterium]|nr:imidazolonepropionase [Gemmatimonadota bacterium]